VLKRVKDVIFPETCTFLDQKTRGCTIYHARPAVCREYPGRPRCAYYDVLQFERRQQDDETVIPVVQITYHEVQKKKTDDGGATEKVWEWEPEEKR
jgi:Fe-S-cluster containining protein